VPLAILSFFFRRKRIGLCPRRKRIGQSSTSGEGLWAFVPVLEK